MLLPQTVVERAFTLCRNGEVRSWGSLRTRLVREGFNADHPELLRQKERILDAMIRATGDTGKLRGGASSGPTPLASSPTRADTTT